MPYTSQVECETCPAKYRIDHWTGFYSTKPTMKQDIRSLMSLIYQSNILLASYSMIKGEVDPA
jgi:hypothetical protein